MRLFAAFMVIVGVLSVILMVTATYMVVDCVRHADSRWCGNTTTVVTVPR